MMYLVCIVRMVCGTTDDFIFYLREMILTKGVSIFLAMYMGYDYMIHTVSVFLARKMFLVS